MRKRNIYKAAVGVVIIEILMKLIGFIKQSVVAYYYGATQSTDAYFVANDFMVSASEIFIGAAKVSLITIYTSILFKKGKKHGDEMMSKFLFLFLPLSILVVSLIALLAPILSIILAPSFNAEQSLELQKYIILLSGIIVFTVSVMIFETVLNANEVFIISKIRSLIYSLCVIIACIIASQRGIIALIIAQYASFIIYLLIQYISSKRYFKIKIVNPLKNKYLKKVLKLMLPIMLGNSIIRINYLVDKAIASSLGTGGVSALAYSQTIDQFVVVIIINSISSVMFAHFANLVAKKEKNKINSVLDNTISALFLVLVPISIITIIEAGNIVSIIYGRGNFSNEASLLAAIALQGYAIRYAFAGLREITTQGLYAHKEVKRPMINSLISTVINIIVSISLIEKLGILSIALGTTASAFVGTILNIYSYKKIDKSYNFNVLKSLIIKSIPGAIIGLAISYLINSRSNCPPLLELILITAIVFSVYYITLLFLKSEELTAIIHKVNHYIKKQKARNQ